MAIRKEPTPSEEDTLVVQAELSTSKGAYTNLAVVRHSREEFLIDFMFRFRSETQLVSRVVLSPGHAQRLSDALVKNLAVYNELREQAPTVKVSNKRVVKRAKKKKRVR